MPECGDCKNFEPKETGPLRNQKFYNAMMQAFLGARCGGLPCAGCAFSTESGGCTINVARPILDTAVGR